MPKPFAIKDVVDEVIRGLGPEKGMSNQEIFAALNSALDKKTIVHIKPERYSNRKLTIRVDSSGWLYKLNLEKNKILDTINKALPQAEIKELYFKIGSV